MKNPHRNGEAGEGSVFTVAVAAAAVAIVECDAGSEMPCRFTICVVLLFVYIDRLVCGVGRSSGRVQPELAEAGPRLTEPNRD